MPGLASVPVADGTAVGVVTARRCRASTPGTAIPARLPGLLPPVAAAATAARACDRSSAAGWRSRTAFQAAARRLSGRPSSAPSGPPLAFAAPPRARRVRAHHRRHRHRRLGVRVLELLDVVAIGACGRDLVHRLGVGRLCDGGPAPAAAAVAGPAPASPSAPSPRGGRSATRRPAAAARSTAM